MSPNETAVKLVFSKEGELRSLRFESAFVVDGSGAILLIKNADTDLPFELSFSEQEIEGIRIASGVIFTHNHPHGWQYDADDPRHDGYSFSPDDIHLACRAEVEELRAVSPHFRFSMRPPSGGWNQGFWPVIEAVFQMEYATANRELTLEALNGRLSLAKMQVELLHLTWIRVAGILGLTYNRREE